MALTSGEALSTYGVLTGMALPLILFPSTITHSVSVMLLPAVAESKARNQKDRIGVYCGKDHTVRAVSRHSVFRTVLPGTVTVSSASLPQRRGGTLYCNSLLYLSFYVSVHHTGQYHQRAWKTTTLYFIQSLAEVSFSYHGQNTRRSKIHRVHWMRRNIIWEGFGMNSGISRCRWISGWM